MTLTWILVGLTLLIIAIILRAIPRLLPQIYSNQNVFFLYLVSAAIIFSVLIYYWKLGLVFAAFFLAIAIAFGIFDPVFGFCVYLAFIVFRPWELWPTDTIFLLVPRIGALWTIGLALIVGIREKKFPVDKRSYLLPCFFLWCLVSSLKSSFVGAAMTGNFQMLLPSLVLFILIQFWISDPNDYDLITDSFSMSMVVTAILAIILFLGSQDDQGRIETMGILSNSNDIAALCVLALPFTLKPLLSDNPIHNKMFSPFYLLSSLPLLIVIYFSQSRGALIALFCMIGAWMFNRFRVKWYYLIVFLAVMFGAVQYVSGKRESDDLNQSTESRISYWIAGANMAIHNPVLGVGMGRYPEEFENYSKEHLYEFGNRTAHSSWVLILAETGIPGLALFATLFIIALKGTFKARHLYPETFLGLLGYGIAMSFLSHSYLFYPYLILGLSFAVIRLNKLSEETT